MKKLLSVLLILFVVIAPKAFAAEVLTMEASESTSGVITVTGTTADEVIAVSASVYTEDGTFVKVVHGQVNDDNTYSITIEAEAKKYIVRVADYNGGAYLEATVDPNAETATVVSNNAKTGDIYHVYIALLVIGLIGAGASAFYLVKKSK